MLMLGDEACLYFLIYGESDNKKVGESVGNSITICTIISIIAIM